GPHSTVAWPDRHMDLTALRHEGVAREHHLVLFAHQSADTSIRTFVGVKAGCVAITPRHPLEKSRFELAMTSQDATFATDEQQCRVHGSARPGLQLHDADDHI